MSKELDGQLNIFDIAAQPGPATYGFKRYLGQSVQHLNGATGKIYKMDKYYTFFKDRLGKDWVGTPTTISPLNPELDDAVRVVSGVLSLPVERPDCLVEDVHVAPRILV